SSRPAGGGISSHSAVVAPPEVPMVRAAAPRATAAARRPMGSLAAAPTQTVTPGVFLGPPVRVAVLVHTAAVTMSRVATTAGVPVVAVAKTQPGPRREENP